MLSYICQQKCMAIVTEAAEIIHQRKKDFHHILFCLSNTFINSAKIVIEK